MFSDAQKIYSILKGEKNNFGVSEVVKCKKTNGTCHILITLDDGKQYKVSAANSCGPSKNAMYKLVDVQSNLISISNKLKSAIFNLGY